MSMIKVPTWKFKSWNYMRSQSGKLRHAQGPTTALLRVSSSLSFSFPQRFHLWHHQHQQQQHWHQKSSTRVSIRGASFSAADHLSPKLDKLGVRKIGLHTLLLLLRSRDSHTLKSVPMHSALWRFADSDFNGKVVLPSSSISTNIIVIIIVFFLVILMITTTSDVKKVSSCRQSN